MSAATVPLAIIVVAAPLGALDVLYFHVWKFRLYARLSARAEVMTHIVRSVLVGSTVLLLVTRELHGAWVVGMVGVFALDLVNDLADTALEKDSRREFGGLPRSESMIHIAGSTLAGAAGGAYLMAAWPLASMPTALVAIDGLPDWLVWSGWLTALGAFAIAALKTVLVVRTSLAKAAT